MNNTIESIIKKIEEQAKEFKYTMQNQDKQFIFTKIIKSNKIYMNDIVVSYIYHKQTHKWDLSFGIDVHDEGYNNFNAPFDYQFINVIASFLGLLKYELENNNIDNAEICKKTTEDSIPSRHPYKFIYTTKIGKCILIQLDNRKGLEDFVVLSKMDNNKTYYIDFPETHYDGRLNMEWGNYHVSKKNVIDKIANYLISMYHSYTYEDATNVPDWFKKGKHDTHKWCQKEAKDILKYYQKLINSCKSN